MTVISPFPKVFSDVDGIETFASVFELLYTDSQNETQQLKITPDIYFSMEGPYNRRNVYGAALSYGPTPKFPKKLFDVIFTYGLENPGPLKKEFCLPPIPKTTRIYPF